MKNPHIILMFLAISGMLFTGCQKKKGENIIPENLKVNVTDAISFPDLDKKKSLLLSDSILSGRDLYQQLRTLVYISDFSADMIQGALNNVRQFDITKPASFSYTSSDDNQVKTLTVKQNYLYQKETWDYGLLISDEKAGKAFQIVWNLSPLKIVAILHPMAYNVRSLNQRHSFIKVEYNEDNQNYDRTMIVSIVGLDSTNVKFVKNLKVFFGQKGDIVSLYGNFNMPYGYVVSAQETPGRSFCFKAKNNTKLDIAVAICAIPHTTLSSIGTLWSYYSMDKVLERQIMAAYPNMGLLTLNQFIKNAVGIAYFSGTNGFVSNDKDNPDPGKFTSEFIDMSNINPWTPATIESMNINF